MIYARTTAIIGLIITLIPFLGFPSSFKTILLVLVGIVLLYVGYKEYRLVENAKHLSEEKTKTYTESMTQQTHESSNV